MGVRGGVNVWETGRGIKRGEDKLEVSDGNQDNTTTT